MLKERAINITVLREYSINITVLREHCFWGQVLLLFFLVCILKRVEGKGGEIRRLFMRKTNTKTDQIRLCKIFFPHGDSVLFFFGGGEGELQKITWAT